MKWIVHLCCRHRGRNKRTRWDEFSDTFIYKHCTQKRSHLIIVWWQLIQELLDSELLSWTVDVGDLILRQTREIQLDLGGKWQRIKLLLCISTHHMTQSQIREHQDKELGFGKTLLKKRYMKLTPNDIFSRMPGHQSEHTAGFWFPPQKLSFLKTQIYIH